MKKAKTKAYVDPMSEPFALYEDFLRLIAQHGWRKTTLSLLCETNGVSLAQLRERFPDKTALLEGYSATLDVRVLGHKLDLGEDQVRERLFDLLIERLDRAKPHRSAVQHIRSAAMGDPLLAQRLNKSAVRSLEWMLRAAGVSDDGLLLTARAQALLLLLMPAFNTWLQDDDPGMARTMARLDKELHRAERLAGGADRLLSGAERVRSLAENLGDLAARFAPQNPFSRARSGRSETTDDLSPAENTSNDDLKATAAPGDATAEATGSDDLPTIAEFEDQNPSSQTAH